MKFSLIMATLGRFDEIVVFLDSLANQTHKDFELIIVDQNNDDRIEKLCSTYHMDIKVIKSETKGLSFNRNLGLKYVSGDAIAFPDDDCEYDDNTLNKAAFFFNNNPDFGFYTCSTKEKNSERSVLPKKSGDTVISAKSVMRAGISFTIFIRADNFHSFRFDEYLGVGAEFGSGEESDLLFYLLKNNEKGFYHSSDYVFHPYKPITLERAFEYGKGYGAVHKKAVFFYGFYEIFFIFFLSLLAGLIKIILHPKQLKERIATLRGRIYGFSKYQIKPHA